MSNRAKQTTKQFPYTNTHEVPALENLQTEWDLVSLYYTNEKDSQIENDIVTAENAYRKFVRKWKKKDFTSSPKVLAEALREKEALAGMPEGSRPGRYFSFRLALDTNDEEAARQLALLERRFRPLQDSMLFFSLTLGALPKKQQRAFSQAKELEHFHYYLERLFLAAQHNLSEEQEKIINLKSSQSYGRWTDMLEKLICNRTVKWKGAVVHIPEALETLDTLPSKQKPKLWALIIAEMEELGKVAEHEFNAIITDVRTEDDLRGYKKPYSATALAYEDTEKSIENLVAAVSEQGFKQSRKFYKLKAQYHSVDTLPYANKYDSVGNLPDIPFEKAVDICRDVFYGVKTEYGEIFDRMLTGGQIDVYPKKGKRGGAFMSGQVGHPTHIFLNHKSNFKSLETLAHEMGHAIHTERAKCNSPFYEGFSTTTAETASTLFENLVFDAVYDQANETQREILLHDRLTRDISTIQRQIAFFNVELEVHNTIHERGAMTNEELRACMEKHLKSYLGPAVDITKQDGYCYVYVPHLRYGFYVYTYSFGLLMSTIMSNHYKADNNYVEKIDEFLCLGESKTVANIFKQIGINTNKTDVYTEALKTQAADINRFAKFVKKKSY